MKQQAVNHSWQFLIVALLAVLFATSGCPPNDQEDYFVITGGAMHGINGYEGMIAADVSVSPGRGTWGTPIDVTVVFTSGAYLVEEVYLYDAFGSIDPREFWYFELRDTLDQVDNNTWKKSQFLYLTGYAGIERFYALNSEGTKICVGDARVNGGM